MFNIFVRSNFVSEIMEYNMVNTTRQDESALIADLRNGSDKAFSALFDLYGKRLFAFCMLYCKHREQSQDIVQDVFLALWNKRREIREGTDSIYSLLFVMAKNELVNAYRMQLNSAGYEQYVYYCNERTQNEGLAYMEFEEFERLLNRMIDKLPATQREVVRLSKFEGLKVRDISEQLKLSEQTVKNQLSLGMKQLRKRFGILKLVFYLLSIIN